MHGYPHGLEKIYKRPCTGGGARDQKGLERSRGVPVAAKAVAMALAAAVDARRVFLEGESGGSGRVNSAVPLVRLRRLAAKLAV